MHSLENSTDLKPLFDRVERDNIRYVLLGEASHGTSEFYKWRAEITKHLISEKGFSFIAVEGDWPDCYRVNRYVKGMSTTSDKNAYDILYSFNRWPTWMWANREILELIEWLREYNLTLSEEQKVGFYGLDVYSLWESLDAVIKYLKRVDPKAVQTAIQAYRCFEPYGQSVEDYARATAFVPDSCEDEVIEMLIDLHSKASRYQIDGLAEKEAYFNAEQNAIVTRNAEIYYRKMIQGGTATWNIRDTHMMDTLTRLMDFYGKNSAKSIIWAHNTHIGDARHTDMAKGNMVNLGQLVRQQAGQENVLLVGFGTHSGTVIAAREWGERMEKMNVPPAVQGSWDNIIHNLSDGKNCLLVFRKNKSEEHAKEEYLINEAPEEQLRAEKKRGQRAIGVVYNPEHERYGNYVPTILTDRYDAFVYLDKSNAIHPLYMAAEAGEVKEDLPETFPTGL